MFEQNILKQSFEKSNDLKLFLIDRSWVISMLLFSASTLKTIGPMPEATAQGEQERNNHSYVNPL